MLQKIICPLLLSAFLFVSPLMPVNTAVHAATDYFTYGVKLFNKRRYKEAVTAFKHVTKANPRNTKAIYYLAASLQNAGDVPSAVHYYKYLVSKYPTAGSARYAKAALAKLQASGYQSGKSSRTGSRSSRRSSDRIPDSESIGFRKQGQQGHLIVNCRINGRNLPMMFDTGSTICMVGKNHLQLVGLTPPKGPPTDKVKAVGGIVGAWIMPTKIALGRIERTIELVVIEKLRTPLLGQSFYGDLKYDIDNSRGVISFKKPGGRADFIPANTIDVPLIVEGSNLVVTAKVNGRPMPFFFDTGARASILTMDEKRALGNQGFRKVGEGSATGAAGKRRSVQYEVSLIELGPIRKRNLIMAVSPGYRYKYGLLGRDFFGNKRFIVDKANKVVKFYR